MIFSDSAKNLKSGLMHDVFEKIANLENKGKKIIHWEIGDPEFNTPSHIVAGAIRALKGGETHYGASQGLEKLRNAIAERTKKILGFQPDIDQIIIGPSLLLFYFLLEVIANKGDEMIVPDPGFAPYYSLFNFIGVKPIAVPLLEKDGFSMKAKAVVKRLTKKTKLIVMNTPHNPTGAVISKKDIQEIARISKKTGIPILSDEVYDQLIYEGRHYSPAMWDKCRSQTIILNSFSKTYAMTGWRLGYLVGPKELISKIRFLFQNTVYSIPDFIQRAGVAALRGNQQFIKSMRKDYKQRRNLLVSGLNKINGLSCKMPGGAFYVFVNIKKTGMDSKKFSDFVLEKVGVAVLPGVIFGNFGEGYVRVAFTASLAEIKNGLKQLGKLLGTK